MTSILLYLCLSSDSFTGRKWSVKGDDLTSSWSCRENNIRLFVKSLKSLVIADTVLDFIPSVVNVGERHYIHWYVLHVLEQNFSDFSTKIKFLELPSREINYILLKSECSKIELYNAYIKWADHQLLKKGMALTDENRRANHDWHQTHSLPMYVYGPGSSHILTLEEKVEIFLFLNQPMDKHFTTSFKTKYRFPTRISDRIYKLVYCNR